MQRGGDELKPVVDLVVGEAATGCAGGAAIASEASRQIGSRRWGEVVSRRLERAEGLDKRSAVGGVVRWGLLSVLRAEASGCVGLRGAASGMGKKREGGTNGLKYIRGARQGESRRRLVEWTWCECWVACCFGPVVPRYPGEPGCEGS